MIIRSNLIDVPETALWTLHNRAMEAMRCDSNFSDERCIEIFNSIDYDYEKYFGKPDPVHAIRSLDFDREIEKYLKKYPNGTIVNLGEGLETQRYRIKENTALWLSVDLPEAIEVRERFIQSDERHLHLSMSATDCSWFDYVPNNKPVLITAQGLFMYFKEENVKSLIQSIESNFSQWHLIFDTIPIWLSNLTMSNKGWRKTTHYVTPKMPWGIDRSKIRTTLENWLQQKVDIEDLGYSKFPRGTHKWFYLTCESIPFLKKIIPSIIKVTQIK
jgi:O-methyltransferase involved in polyketide biosynthesis